MENKLDVKSLAEKAYELGFEYEKKYGGCSQCTIASLQETFGQQNDDIFKSSTGLIGGVGGLTDTGCGAYSAGAMFLSFHMGRERANFDDLGAVHKTLDAVTRLHDRFIQEYGTAICRDIHMKLLGRSYFLPDEDEWAKFENAGGHTKICPEVVGKAARWVVEIMHQEALILKK
jgi:C_GCAxxG_C_C family probable redox protein